MRRHPALHLAPALVLAAACARPAPAAASPVDLFGLGARAQALAGAVVSTSAGCESAYYNPAGLAFDRRPSFTLGYQSATFDLEVNGAARAARDAPLLTLGFGVPLPFGGALADRLALGLAFALPQSAILVANLPRPGDPSFVIVENRAQTVSVLGALAVRVTDALALGVGALALAELSGDIAVAPNAEGRLGTRVKDELVANYAFIAGVAWRPAPWFAAGLTWRDASTARFSLPITADLGDSFGIPLPLLDVTGTAQFDPAEAALEVALRPSPWLLAALSAVWQRWSEFPLPIGYTAAADGVAPLPAPDFHDTVSLRLGLEATAPLNPDVILSPRLGVSLEPSPVPAQTGLSNFLDGDRVVLGFGVGLAFGPLHLDLAGQLHVIARHTDRKDPAQVPEAAANPGSPAITSAGTVLVGSLQLGLDL